jgi:hypothetical protein
MATVRIAKSLLCGGFFPSIHRDRELSFSQDFQAPSQKFKIFVNDDEQFLAGAGHLLKQHLIHLVSRRMPFAEQTAVSIVEIFVNDNGNFVKIQANGFMHGFVRVVLILVES